MYVCFCLSASEAAERLSAEREEVGDARTHLQRLSAHEGQEEQQGFERAAEAEQRGSDYGSYLEGQKDLNTRGACQQQQPAAGEYYLRSAMRQTQQEETEDELSRRLQGMDLKQNSNCPPAGHKKDVVRFSECFARPRDY